MTDRLIRYAYRALIVLCFLFIFTPILALVVFAFNDSRFPRLPWQGFTLKWFRNVFENPIIMGSLRNSVFVALCVGVIATLLGATAAYCVTRWDFKLKGAYIGIIAAPPLIPVIVLGLSLLVYLRAIHLSGSLLSVIIAHSVLAAPFAFGIVRMRLAEMDADLEQAAWNLGASEWRAIAVIILPQAIPALISAFLLSMAVSWDEFMISWFVSGFDVTLPVNVWNTFTAHVSAEVNAVGTIAFGTTIALVVLAAVIFFRMGARKRKLLARAGK